MSVYKAINAIQAELAKEGISKARKNEQQGYKFRGIDDVYNTLSPIMAKHGLCILPRVVSRECVERVNKKDTALFYVTVGMEFDFVASEDGSKHTVVTYGEAMDSGDKATNKAMSAAYKYACMQAFSIPTEGDNDADATTHEVQARKFPSPVASAQAAISPELLKEARRIAEVLCVLHSDMEHGEDVSYSAFETVETLDNEMKLAVWNQLAPNSKVRSWIKKVAAEHRKEAA